MRVPDTNRGYSRHSMDSAWEYRVELRHLRAFVAVAEELHFGRAATRLHLAQPGLTKQIQQLEVTLGVKLLERSSRSVALTAPGAAFFEEAQRTLEQTRRAVDAALRSARGERGRLRIGFSATAPHGAFPHVIRNFRLQYPDVRLELSEIWSADQAEALLADLLDLGFANEPAVASELLDHQPVQQDKIVVALPAAHELADREEVAMSELAGNSFITFARSTAPIYFDELIAACHRAGFSPRIAQEIREVPATLSLVAAGLGIALLPGAMRTLRRDGVIWAEIADSPPIVSTVIAWRRGNPSETLRRFLEVARDTTWPAPNGRIRAAS
jgi:DNA-binding transcriptional LysR family regulator